jgi:hypothetical protein
MTHGLNDTVRAVSPATPTWGPGMLEILDFSCSLDGKSSMSGAMYSDSGRRDRAGDEIEFDTISTPSGSNGPPSSDPPPPDPDPRKDFGGHGSGGSGKK